MESSAVILPPIPVISTKPSPGAIPKEKKVRKFPISLSVNKSVNSRTGMLIICLILSAVGVKATSFEAFWEYEYEEIEVLLDTMRSYDALIPEGEVYEHSLDPHGALNEADRNPVDVVLRRTEALLAHISQMESAPDLGQQSGRLNELKQAASGGYGNESTAKAAFLDICRLRREIALKNPLLDFDQIVTMGANFAGGFIQTVGYQANASAADNQWYREDYYNTDWTKNNIEGSYGYHGGGNSKCDPQLDCSSPSAGPRIITNFKTETSQVKYLIRDIINKNPGACSLIGNSDREWKGIYDLSFDGDTLLFATSPSGCHRSLHLFKCAVDGSGLVQLTDGALSDYDPAFLPSGKIVFVSLRSWTASRCQPGGGGIGPFSVDGRTYKGEMEKLQAGGQLWRMNGDGSDMHQISFHETNENHPVVDHDGKLVYMRWDYIDRDFNAGHHLWTCWPDGRDPRAPAGNWARPHYADDPVNTRGRRPETHGHARPISDHPGEYIAVAGHHHQFLPGVPVLINTKIEDDNEMAQTKIIKGRCFTHEQGPSLCPPCGKFKLGEVFKRYLTPWPLNRDFYLISRNENHTLGRGITVMLLDRFGNEIVLSMNGGIGPRPLRSRPKPPNLPDQSWSGNRSKEEKRPKAVISVNNVNISDFEWPAGTKIEALRIIQIVPKPWSCPLGNNMAIGWMAGGIARHVLGTVPVEEDGSAYFLAPINSEIYFQALDSLGMAMQSMRSGTYAHPGEHLSCLGCHESKWNMPPPNPSPIALSRDPSPITPEPEGTLPFNFHVLVKPVFQNTCLPCHEKEGRGLMDLNYVDPQDSSKPGRLHKYAFFFRGAGQSPSSNEGMRTEAGNFGFKASDLGKKLLSTHRDRLTEEEFRRVVVWVDANSMNMSACYDFDKQMAGEVVWPMLGVNTPGNPQALDPGGDLTTNRRKLQKQQRMGDGRFRIGVRETAGGTLIVIDTKRAVPVTIYDIRGRIVYRTILDGKMRESILNLTEKAGTSCAAIVSVGEEGNRVVKMVRSIR